MVKSSPLQTKIRLVKQECHLSFIFFSFVSQPWVIWVFHNGFVTSQLMIDIMIFKKSPSTTKITSHFNIVSKPPLSFFHSLFSHLKSAAKERSAPSFLPAISMAMSSQAQLPTRLMWFRQWASLQFKPSLAWKHIGKGGKLMWAWKGTIWRGK